MVKKTKSNKDLIYGVIASSGAACSHHDILEAIENTCNRVTVYRILDRLEEEGKVHRIVDVDGVSKYAECADDCATGHHHDNHIHFSCKVCHEVTCLDLTADVPALPKDYKQESLNITVTGVCPLCLGK